MTNLETVQAPPCDDLLDYIYGGLSPARTKSFEDHLASCQKCQAEVNATKRIRNLTREVLPPVEPAADRMAAIQAQVLHAAAQRGGGGGKVIPLFRKVLRHPAYSAMAAMFVVGAFIVTQWSHLKMPAKEAAPASRAQPAAAPPASPPPKPEAPPPPEESPIAGLPPTTTATPQAAPTPPAMEPVATKGKLAPGGAIGGEAAPVDAPAKTPAPSTRGNKSPSVDDFYATRRDAQGSDELWQRKEAKAEAEARPAAKKKAAAAGDMFDEDTTIAAAGDKAGARAGGSGTGATHSSSGPLQEESKRIVAKNDEKPSEKPVVAQKPAAAKPAPMPDLNAGQGYAQYERAKDGKKSSAGLSSLSTGSNSNSYDLADNKYRSNTDKRANESQVAAGPPPAQAVQPAPVAVAATPTPTPTINAPADNGNFGKLEKQQRESFDTLRKRGEAQARAGKCEEARRSFDEANRLSNDSTLAAQNQLSYAKCLREAGRYDAAQVELDSLRNSNAQTKALAAESVEREQTNLTNSRRSVGAPAHAAPAAPAKAARKASEPASSKAADAY